MPSPGSIVFLGTGVFAVPTLKALALSAESVSLVVTQPDRPKGRGRKLVPTPLKAEAEKLGLEVFQPEKINDVAALDVIRSKNPEFLVVVDYGQLLKKPLLEIARRGAVNVHPSLLPLNRGPAPVAYAILSGEEETGVATMLLDEGMDSGPVLRVRKLRIPQEATAGDLSEILSHEGAELLVETLAGVRTGEIEPAEQDHSRATFSKLFDKDFLKVDWALPAKEVAAKINALSPFPGARASLGGKNLKLLRAGVSGLNSENKSPGEVIDLNKKGFVVACGDGSVVVRMVHPEGRKAMDADSFIRGGSILVGDTLGS